MAAAPRWKVYRGSEYMAACKYLEDAARVVSGMEDGTIRDGHTTRSIVWREGIDGQAGESCDAVVAFVNARRADV